MDNLENAAWIDALNASLRRGANTTSTDSSIRGILFGDVASTQESVTAEPEVTTPVRTLQAAAEITSPVRPPQITQQATRALAQAPQPSLPVDRRVPDIVLRHYAQRSDFNAEAVPFRPSNTQSQVFNQNPSLTSYGGHGGTTTFNSGVGYDITQSTTSTRQPLPTRPVDISNLHISQSAVPVLPPFRGRAIDFSNPHLTQPLVPVPLPLPAPAMYFGNPRINQATIPVTPPNPVRAIRYGNPHMTQSTAPTPPPFVGRAIDFENITQSTAYVPPPNPGRAIDFANLHFTQSTIPIPPPVSAQAIDFGSPHNSQSTAPIPPPFLGQAISFSNSQDFQPTVPIAPARAIDFANLQEFVPASTSHMTLAPAVIRQDNNVPRLAESRMASFGGNLPERIPGHSSYTSHSDRSRNGTYLSYTQHQNLSGNPGNHHNSMGYGASHGSSAYNSSQGDMNNGLQQQQHTHFDSYATSASPLPSHAQPHAAQFNPYAQEHTSNGNNSYHQASQYSQPLQYHLYANFGPTRDGLTQFQRSARDFFLPDALREELQKKSAATLQILPSMFYTAFLRCIMLIVTQIPLYLLILNTFIRSFR